MTLYPLYSFKVRFDFLHFIRHSHNFNYKIQRRNTETKKH